MRPAGRRARARIAATKQHECLELPVEQMAPFAPMLLCALSSEDGVTVEAAE
jgi:hypothetical protein